MSAKRAVVVSAIALVACGGSPPGDTGPTSAEAAAGTGAAGKAGHAGAPGAAGSPGSGGAPSSSAGGSGGTPSSAGAGAAKETACDGGHELKSVSGTLHDEGGAPVVVGLAQTCLRVAKGKAVCVKPEAVAPDGSFTLAVPDAMQCVAKAVLRVRATSAATLYCVVDGPPQIAFDPPLALAKIPPATSLPPEGDTTAMRAITFDDGLTIEATPDSLLSPNGAYADIGGRRTTPDGRCFPGGPVEGAYAFHPEMNVSGATGKIRIPNTTHLAPGTEVDLLVMGGLSCTRPDGSSIEEGTTDAFATAKVDPTGAFLEGGTGLPCLTWLAYRKKLSAPRNGGEFGPFRRRRLRPVDARTHAVVEPMRPLGTASGRLPVDQSQIVNHVAASHDQHALTA